MDSPSRDARTRSRQLGAKCASRACDQCRLRKTRCSLSRPCAECLNMGLDCTFLQPQKKRGPPARRAAQIRHQQQQQPGGPASVSQSGLSPSSDLAVISEPLPHLTNLEVPQAIVGGLGPTATAPLLIEHANRQQDYNPSLLGDATTTPWNDASDLEYWLPDSFGSQAYPSFGFQGSNIFVKQTLPPIIDDSANLTLGNTRSFLPMQREVNEPNTVPPHGDHVRPFQIQDEFWPPYINETSLIPWLDVYFDRLHPTLPVLNRSSLFTRLVLQDHRRNRQFGAMILSLCAFSLTQPIDISERPTSSSRADQAKILVQEAMKMRSFSADFGENPSIEAVLTSFFLFGYLFGSNQHNAARLRLREAIDLASTLGLNNPATYADCTSAEVKGQWLRTYLVLSVTERAYALQRQHPLTFTGPSPHEIIRSAAEEIRTCTTHRLDISGIIVHTEKEAEGMLGLSLLMEILDAIDEEILICWNSRCTTSTGNGDAKCRILTEAKVLSIYRNLAKLGSGSGRYGRSKKKSDDYFELDSDQNGDYSHAREVTTTVHPDSTSTELHSTKTFRNFLSETQCADILLTRKWVQDRLWNLCYTHGLLRHEHGPTDPETGHSELSFGYALVNASRTLELCRLLRISAIEAHGVGIIEKLYNIATSALLTNTGATAQGGIPDIEGGSEEALHILAKSYLKLMQTLRGGNHPYLPRYRAHLVSLGWA
ncbi:hypothetical protein BJY01DRAFT_258100 [Aspergillus pseudoustus]|uniref:Zn(2)-C6 fungal-type domain-containing protein n=1 Tax=Aspergillus pseudoustus TaxID=1810923 RepID=A0ABR4JDQ2_9EURO